MKATLSVSMIVKNEERHLGRLLETVGVFSDEIIILDTGSTDRTRQIALDYGASVHDFVWCDDFAKARNVSLSRCTRDFVMWLDADDVITPEDAKKLCELMTSAPKWDVLHLPYLYDSSKRKKPPRIFRNGIGVQWIYPIHEILKFPDGVRRKRDVEDICIYHKPLREAAANSGRNLRILEKAVQDPKYINSNYMYWHIAKEYSGLRDSHRALHFFEEAIKRTASTDSFVMSREYFGLAKQYRRLGQLGLAIESFATAALHYTRWREPYCGMADCLWELGAGDAASECVRLADTIHDHRLGMERAELYDPVKFGAQYLAKLTQPSEPPVALRAPSDPLQRLVAGGDVCLARQMAGHVSVHGYDWPLRSLWPLLQTADVALVNLECVLSNVGSPLEKGGRRPFYYRGAPRLLDVLSSGGISVVTTANNHAMDFGSDALLQQHALLQESGFAVCGSGGDFVEAARPCYGNAGDVTVAVIGIDTESECGAAHPQSAGINHASGHFEVLTRLIPAIAQARTRADLVLVSPHWGPNWAEAPSESTRRLARGIIDLGADAILGHSAHIVQGVEIYKGRPIIYDMGSLLFDRVSENRIKLSALWELEFDKQAIRRLVIHPVLLEPGRATPAPPVVAEKILKLIAGLSKNLGEFAGSITGDKLIVECSPSKRTWTKTSNPPSAITGKASRPVNTSYDSPPAELRLDAVPVWADCQFNQDIVLLGCRFPSVVHPGRGFWAEVLLRVAGPLRGRWEGRFSICSASDQVTYTWVHPIADGSCPPSEWNAGELIVDKTYVRPPRKTAEGTYSVRYDFVERDSGKTFCPLTKGRETRKDQIVLGTMQISEKIPLVANIDHSSCDPKGGDYGRGRPVRAG